jgi:hypothetical protein
MKVVPAAPPPEVEREVVIERPVEREVVVEREVEVEPAPREVIREVVVERAPTRTRNVLTRPVREREREVVVEQRPAPREVVREVVVERPRTREVVVERAPARTRAVEVAEEKPAISLIPAGLGGRCLGWFGERLRVAGLPRVDVAIERETRIRPIAARDRQVYLAEPLRRPCAIEEGPRHVCAPAPPPVYYQQALPPYAPSPQSR